MSGTAVERVTMSLPALRLWRCPVALWYTQP
jgi:hypothetical protein